MKHFILGILIASLGACQNNEAGLEGEPMGEKLMAYEMADAVRADDLETTQQPEESNVSQYRKLIKNAQLRYEVTNLALALAKIRTQAENLGGYVADERSGEHEHERWNSLAVKVPTEQFESFLELISKGVSKFDTREISSLDVTEEFTDLQTRIASKRKIEQRYLEILKTAKTVEDILKVEAQAGNIRVEIERMEGRLKYLSHQTSLSTLNIHCYQLLESPIVDENTFITRLQAGFSSGVSIIKSMLVGLVTIWPLLILAAAGYLIFRFRQRKLKVTE